MIAKFRIKNPTQDVTLTGDFPTETETNITHPPRVVNHQKHEFYESFSVPGAAAPAYRNGPSFHSSE